VPANQLITSPECSILNKTIGGACPLGQKTGSSVLSVLILLNNQLEILAELR
jgi:hypothetical protein